MHLASKGLHLLKYQFIALMISMCVFKPFAQERLEYDASILTNVSSGEFAPYFISTMTHGKILEKNSALIDLKAERKMDLSQRLSWSYGAEVVTGYSHKAHYEKFDQASQIWHQHSLGPSPVWLQQLYASIKYRSVFLTLGMKERGSKIFNQELSSGDFIESGNARPIPQMRVGFIDFQNIPFTKGWVQILGCVAYGKFTDNDWMEKFYNYYTNHIATGTLYTYKNIYFRTNPSKPLVITIGAQWSGTFGGETFWYRSGELIRYEKHPSRLVEYFKMLLAMESGNEGYYYGDHIGCYDFKAQYTFSQGSALSAYFQWPWEDGSGLGKLNGWDGTWGIEYASNRKRAISGFVAEYLDFTNQSGPLHYAPGDDPDTNINLIATGADDYYNNFYYNSWANYGLAIGNPFILSPVYNSDGYPQFLHNRTRGCHLAMQGWLSPVFQYTLKYSYQKAWGNGRVPVLEALENNSVSIKALYDASSNICPGLSLAAQIAYDNGSLRGNNFGMMLSATYSGDFTFGKHKQ